MGSNMAEAHPVGFQWVMEAKLRGAKVFHIDPRFTRTSAVADTYVSIRAGSDIVFLGGIVNHILSNERDFREYVLAYTNAATIVNEGFPTPRTSTGCSPASTRTRARTSRRRGSTRGRSSTAPTATSTPSARRRAG